MAAANAPVEPRPVPHDGRCRIFLTFNGTQVEEPVVYQLGHKFNVVTNIRGASITSNFGIMALELTGNDKDILSAIAYIEGLGIKTTAIDHDD